MNDQPITAGQLVDHVHTLYDVLAVPDVLAAPDLVHLILHEPSYDYWRYGALG